MMLRYNYIQSVPDSMQSFNIRNYTKNDLEECTDCYIGGFFENNVKGDREFLRDCTDALVGMSNFTLVAETDGKIVGLLGAAYKKSFDKKLVKTFSDTGRHKNFITITMKRRLGLYRLSSEFRKEFERFFTEVMMRPPGITDDCDCELVVLTSRKDSRNGVGTALVNGMVARCKENGANRIRIATDTSFNYRFYDKFGTVVYEKEHIINGERGRTFVYEIVCDRIKTSENNTEQ